MINDYDSNAKKRQNEIINKTNRAQCYVEKPMMKSMMLDLKDKKVLRNIILDTCKDLKK